ncbi:unnamed protein product [Schistosoma mattheei]|uniref:Uncharacterized protein n=1 Tax=Schistosoma mattheei TaxID=31246 RepID=A0AA85BE89_9TREM|nr:unnamed protein product [Schistosoma mattheei]
MKCNFDEVRFYLLTFIYPFTSFPRNSMFYSPSTGVMVNPHTGLLPSTLDPNQMRNQDSQTISYDLLNSSSNLLSLLTHSLQPIQSTTFFLLNSVTINSILQNGETTNHSPLINSATHPLQTDIIGAENDQVEISQHSHSLTNHLSHSYSTYSQHNQPQLQIFGPSTVPSVQQSSITGINYHPPTVSENLVTNGQAHYLITGAPNGTNPSHTTIFANHIQTSPVTLIPEIDYNACSIIRTYRNE